MTQEAETVAMDLNIVSCQTCDALFIESERRQTCPSCGGPPVGPYFQFVLDGSGLHQRDGAAPDLAAGEEPVPEEEATEAPLPAAPEEEVRLAGGVREMSPAEEFVAAVEGYLVGEDATEDDLRTILADMGAEPEAAKTAVGRLVAVRDLLQELREAGVKAEVEVAAEETPAEAPEPEGGPENAPETP